MNEKQRYWLVCYKGKQQGKAVDGSYAFYTDKGMFPKRNLEDKLYQLARISDLVIVSMYEFEAKDEYEIFTQTKAPELNIPVTNNTDAEIKSHTIQGVIEIKQELYAMDEDTKIKALIEAKKFIEKELDKVFQK